MPVPLPGLDHELRGIRKRAPGRVGPQLQPDPARRHVRDKVATFLVGAHVAPEDTALVLEVDLALLPGFAVVEHSTAKGRPHAKDEVHASPGPCREDVHGLPTSTHVFRAAADDLERVLSGKDGDRELPLRVAPSLEVIVVDRVGAGAGQVVVQAQLRIGDLMAERVRFFPGVEPASRQRLALLVADDAIDPAKGAHRNARRSESIRALHVEAPGEVGVALQLEPQIELGPLDHRHDEVAGGVRLAQPVRTAQHARADEGSFGVGVEDVQPQGYAALQLDRALDRLSRVEVDGLLEARVALQVRRELDALPDRERGQAILT